MAEIKASIVNQHTLKLEEDGKKGDIIDLKTINLVDNNIIMDKIKQGTDTVYNLQLSKEKAILQEQYQLELRAKLSESELNIKKDLNSTVESLKERILNLSNDNANIKTQLENQFKNQELKKSLEFQEILSQKDAKLAKLEQTLEGERNQRIVFEESKIKELNKEIENRKLLSELENLETINSYKNSISELKQKISELLEETSALKREKSSKNIKQVGEDLEKWCLEQYKGAELFGFKNCSLIKDNQVIKNDGDDKGTKGDYIYHIYADETKKLLISSVMCEMKSELLESSNKKTNASHYKKLDEDRNKKGCQYALLISELEPTNTNIIEIVSSYPDMYMIRPAYFLTFLGILQSIALKYKESIITLERERKQFEKEDEIIRKFDEFKNSLLDLTIKNINNKLQSISKKADTIIEAGKSILTDSEDIIDRLLKQLKNKIDSFNINSLVNKINKLN